VSAVVHLAGENIAGGRWSSARKKAIAQSRILSTRNLVRSMQRLAQPPGVFLAASAVGIYGDRGEERLDEGSPAGAGFLAQVCRDWEKEIFEARPLGIRTVGLRLGVVLGRNGGAVKQMLPPFRLGLGGRLGSGEQWVSWIHVRDVAGLIVHGLESDVLDGPVNGVAPYPATNSEFTQALAKELGRRARLPIPAALLKTVLGDLATVLLSGQRASPKRAEADGYVFLYPRLDSALREICRDFDHEFVSEQWVPRPPEEVFPFFSDAANLAILTPAYLNFKILSRSPGEIKEGTRIDYRLSLHGIPIRWRSLITEWKPMRMFADTQTSGPYSHWRHTHEFVPCRGGTLLRDRVSYCLPLDAITDPVVHPFIRRDLEAIFLYRRKKTQELFGGER